MHFHTMEIITTSRISWIIFSQIKYSTVKGALLIEFLSYFAESAQFGVGKLNASPDNVDWMPSNSQHDVFHDEFKEFRFPFSAW